MSSVFVSIARGARMHTSAVVRLRTSQTAYSAVKPGSESEATTPGSASTEEIAHSSSAYDSTTSRPDTAADQIQSETGADMDSSSAKRQASHLATADPNQKTKATSKRKPRNAKP
ncbi:predicted transporter [Moesziomyces antarcticus T-34]|uniref:Predicted transporter n=1 Tax=Pseudozyma antarctica (strain T-34) TaxID=1151754 RepID=M9LL24_PSEA3|nr:predicted transporter [Moesziomyces antarcticus T-34]